MTTGAVAKVSNYDLGELATTVGSTAFSGSHCTKVLNECFDRAG